MKVDVVNVRNSHVNTFPKIPDDRVGRCILNWNEERLAVIIDEENVTNADVMGATRHLMLRCIITVDSHGGLINAILLGLA